jgi:RNA polymerase primary sigma factor
MYPDCSSKVFLSRSMRHPLLSEDAERRLLVRANAGDPDARNELIVNNQRLVSAIVRKYNPRMKSGDIEVTDLFQVGNMGLMKAISMWDNSKKVKFSTYAFYWVRAYVRRLALKKSSALSLSYQYSEKLVKIRVAKAEVFRTEHRLASPEEIMEKTGLTIEEVRMGEDATRVAFSIENDWVNSEGTLSEKEMRSDIPDETKDTEKDAVNKILFAEVIRELEKMPERTRQVVIMAYGLDGEGEKSLAEIGRMYGISRERVRQMLVWAIEHIRKHMIHGQRLLL